MEGDARAQRKKEEEMSWWKLEEGNFGQLNQAHLYLKIIEH
jgi:hypothetical protein